MKVSDLLPQKIDIDVYDNVCEELAIAFCGPLELTEAGHKEFDDVLDYDIRMISDSYGGLPRVVVLVDGDNFEHKLNRAEKFFYSAAGYCSNDDFEKWFKEND